MNNFNQFFIVFPAWAYLFLAILGLVIGSFLNVVIHRLPKMLWQDALKECKAFIKDQPDLFDNLPMHASNTPTLKTYNLWLPFSHCPQCEHTLKWHQNIPLFSFITQKGRCVYCQANISKRYPLVELLTLVFTLLTVWRFGMTVTAGWVLLLGYGLMVAAFIDIENHLLPDSIILPLLWLGLILNLFNLFVPINNALLGAVLGYTGLRLFTEIFYLIRGRIGMGRGDMKCLALFGAWLGMDVLPFILITAAIAGIIGGIITLTLKKQNWQTQLAFGPYLIIMGLVAIFAKDTIVQYTVHLLSGNL